MKANEPDTRHIDTCQTDAYLGSRAETPCGFCRDRETCVPYAEMRALQRRTAPHVQQVPIVISCSRVRSGWRPWRRWVNVEKRLLREGVRKLCRGCAVMGCRTHYELTVISSRAFHKDEHFVDFGVITCHAPRSRDDASGDRLYQIGEPGKAQP